MKPDAIYKLVQELKRRRVFRGIVVYGASTLVLFEAATNLANVFGKESPPLWFVVLLGIGFLVSLWFSWIYDITPGGIKKTEPTSEHKVPIPKKEVRIYQTTTTVCILIIIGLLTYNIIDGAKAKQIKRLDKSIAVLPLYDTELSPTEAREFEFIGHEITCCLIKVKDYKIVPWEDCRKYPRRGKNYARIGNDLSAAILVDWRPHENNVDRRLSIDLISAVDERLLWSENYKIEGSWPSEICRYSRKISKKITRELRTYLTPQERALIDEQPASSRASMFASIGTAMTQDVMELIQIDYQANDPQRSEYIDSISFEKAIDYFTRAIEEEPTFAEAYANRAKAKIWGMRAGFFDRSMLDESRKDIEKAFELDPDLAEAHVAMGFYYFFGNSEYKWALTSFEKAIELKPNNNEYLFYLSKIHSALGNWEEVRILCNKVFESNPQNALFYTNLGISFAFLGDFPKAIKCQDRAIQLIPQWYAPYFNKITSLIYWGKIDEAKATVAAAEENTDKYYNRILAELDLYEERYTSAIKHIELADEQEFKDMGESVGEAYLLKAKIYKHAGKPSMADEYYRSAVKYFSDQIKFDPQDYKAYSQLGIAYAGIGKNQLAIFNGQKGLQLGRQESTAVGLPRIMYQMAQTYVLTGDPESALNMIKELMNINSDYTSKYIKNDPDMKSLLDDPGLKLVNL